MNQEQIAALAEVLATMACVQNPQIEFLLPNGQRLELLNSVYHLNTNKLVLHLRREVLPSTESAV